MLQNWRLWKIEWLSKDKNLNLSALLATLRVNSSTIWETIFNWKEYNVWWNSGIQFSIQLIPVEIGLSVFVDEFTLSKEEKWIKNPPSFFCFFSWLDSQWKKLFMSVWYWQGTREAGRPLRPLLTESVPAYSFHSFCVRKWKKSCKNHLRSQSYGTHDSKPLKRKIERKIPFSCAFFSLHFKEFYSSLRTTATTGEETDNLCILLAIYYFCLL